MSFVLIVFVNFSFYNYCIKRKAGLHMINLKIDTNKKHTISPYLYMQFMEPLSVADSSIDAAWDYLKDDWHPSVINKVKELAPTMIRYGGCFASYSHWREAIGPKKSRVPMHNHCWGGMFSNYVGTHEVIDFCRKVNAEPLLVANMESEGIKEIQNPLNDTCRMGTDIEAADWVSYCNDPDNAERIANGAEEPFSVKYWQIGNETSYGMLGNRGFDRDACFETTSRFAKKMKDRDNSIKIIGWADKDSFTQEKWCSKMSSIDEIDMLAFHHHMPNLNTPDDPFFKTQYRDDWDKTWDTFMNAYKTLDEHISEMRADAGNKRLAMTEGHFVVPGGHGGRNKSAILSTWAAGVAYARCLNTIMRHSDVLDIATMADFFGNAWQVNAIMIDAPLHMNGGRCYLQPVGSVMSLFGKYQGKHSVDCTYSGNIDAVSSATDNKIFIHIANTDMYSRQEINLDFGGAEISDIKMHCISEKPSTEVTVDNMDVFNPTEYEIKGNVINLPAAAVAAIEITLK